MSVQARLGYTQGEVERVKEGNQGRKNSMGRSR